MKHQVTIFIQNKTEGLKNLQWAFYSGYFCYHGLKAQVLYLPNGMIGSIFVATLAHNDQGMQNLSGLNDYLMDLFQGMELGDGHFLPSVFGDGIFQNLACIVP